MAPGKYAGDVQVSSPFSPDYLDLAVTLTVTAAAPRLSLSPMGFLFNAFEDGPAPPSQTLVVGALNSGVAVDSAYVAPLPSWLILYNPLPNNPTAPWIGGTAPVTIPIAITSNRPRPRNLLLLDPV